MGLYGPQNTPRPGGGGTSQSPSNGGYMVHRILHAQEGGGLHRVHLMGLYGPQNTPRPGGGGTSQSPSNPRPGGGGGGVPRDGGCPHTFYP